LGYGRWILKGFSFIKKFCRIKGYFKLVARIVLWQREREKVNEREMEVQQPVKFSFSSKDTFVLTHFHIIFLPSDDLTQNYTYMSHCHFMARYKFGKHFQGNIFI